MAMSISSHNRIESPILHFMIDFFHLVSCYRHDWRDESVGSCRMQFIAQENCQVLYSHISCSTPSTRRTYHISLGHLNQVGLKRKLCRIGYLPCYVSPWLVLVMSDTDIARFSEEYEILRISEGGMC